MPLKRIVFWQPNHSPHQFPLLDALSRHENGYEVELVLSRTVNPTRQVFSWGAISYEHVAVHEVPSAAAVDVIAGREIGSSIHVFSGVANDEIARIGMEACIRHGAKIAVMAEAGAWRDRHPARYPRLVKHLMLKQKYGKYIQAFLPMGQVGVEWYTRVGYDPGIMTPIGYFVESALVTVPPPATFEILFVGRAVPLKGGDLLLRALGKIKHLQWNASLMTQGQEREKWEALAQSLGLGERVEFRDYETSLAYAQRLASASVLVLPNKGDEGWGAVVNEALMQGTPVICTTLTGAQDMIGPGRGEVVTPDVVSLSLALERQIGRGIPSAQQRTEVAEWTRQHWSGEAGARKLVSALDHKIAPSYNS
ncbi:glycosyltransferase family 4 protein [Deinococcus marmoris]|uniref:glycosyltransferase family 4 protein n=1 Tax=Deinococcus marmoris TaxID=249408 RepID=UPI0004951B06|nr:glycosyltransferase [Deinococcus marmoris]